MKFLTNTQKNILSLLTFDNQPTKIDDSVWWEEVLDLLEMHLIRCIEKSFEDPLVGIYVLTELGRVYSEHPNLPAPETPEWDF